MCSLPILLFLFLFNLTIDAQSSRKNSEKLDDALKNNSIFFNHKNSTNNHEDEHVLRREARNFLKECGGEDSDENYYHNRRHNSRGNKRRGESEETRYDKRTSKYKNDRNSDEDSEESEEDSSDRRHNREYGRNKNKNKKNYFNQKDSDDSDSDESNDRNNKNNRHSNRYNNRNYGNNNNRGNGDEQCDDKNGYGNSNNNRQYGYDQNRGYGGFGYSRTYPSYGKLKEKEEGDITIFRLRRSSYRNNDDAQCLSQCVFGYLEVLDDDRIPSETKLIKWLQDRIQNDLKRIKEMRDIRRCFGRLAVTENRDGCDFSKTLSDCLNLDIE